MNQLKVNEIFYSLQGEGARVGVPGIFIRLSGCNMRCNFCDTDFSERKIMSIQDIHIAIEKYGCKNIIWTGGEPTLQLNDDILFYFKKEGYFNSIETNGSNKVSCFIDYLAISPKVPDQILKKNFHHHTEGRIVVDELRYVIKYGDVLPIPEIHAFHYFLSPEFNGAILDQKNLDWAIKLCLENPIWRLSVQNHKLWKIK